MKKFLIGVIVGAVATAVLTPKTGRDLQDELIDHLNKLQKKIKDFDVKECVSNIEITKESLQEKIEEAKKAIEDFDWAESKEKVVRKFDEVTERLNEIKAQLVNDVD
jgi:gas vesicle protein